MATTMLLCKQCNFENEPERVYCHNCGAKLDRSLLPPEATKREDPVVVQERVRKLVSPRRGLGLRWIRHFFASVVLAALIALLVVMILPPGGVPASNNDAVLDAPTITDDMEAQEQVPGPHRLTYTEDQVNAFLQSAIRGKEDAASVIALKFERLFVHFNEGTCAITAEHSFFGLPLYATTVHTVQIQNGAILTSTLGGGFGRLVVSAKIMKSLEVVFAPVWKVLERDRKLVSQMQSIAFRKESEGKSEKRWVEMITKPVPVKL